jgi:hypothetical protein
MTRTVDITTSTLHWNSVLSTQKAKYMCLDINFLNLLAALDRYEYMRIPIGLFPLWIINQCDLMRKVYNGHIYMEMRRAVWGLPQAGILANKLLQKDLRPMDILNTSETPACGNIPHVQSHLPWWLTTSA